MMRRNLTLSILLVALGLLLCSTPRSFFPVEVSAGTSAPQAGQAQAITEDAGGLHRIVITTARGNTVFVNLPNDRAEGDTISGTVFAEPAGKSDEERAANLLELKDQFIEIAGQKVPATGGSFQLALQRVHWPGEGRSPCCVLSGLGRTFGVYCPPTSPLPFTRPMLLPTYGQAGQPTEVKGQFDGVFGPTDYVKIGGREMKVLAQSPRSTVFFNTSTAIGPTDIEVNEQEQVWKGRFRNLSLRMSAEKYDLRKGERTKLQAVVSGLDGLGEEIPLRFENRSTNVMTMEGGNVQTLTIRPKDVKPGGVYEVERGLTGKQPGAFHIQGVITWREDAAATKPGASRKELDKAVGKVNSALSNLKKALDELKGAQQKGAPQPSPEGSPLSASTSPPRFSSEQAVDCLIAMSQQVGADGAARESKLVADARPAGVVSPGPPKPPTPARLWQMLAAEVGYAYVSCLFHVEFEQGGLEGPSGFRRLKNCIIAKL